jgi:hypothetical protein
MARTIIFWTVRIMELLSCKEAIIFIRCLVKEHRMILCTSYAIAKRYKITRQLRSGDICWAFYYFNRVMRVI